MRILIIYWDSGRNIKLKGVHDHLYAIEKHFPEHEYIYWDGYFGVPAWMNNCGFDALIIHNTFMCLRESFEPDRLMELTRAIKGMACVKIAIPQDEYDMPDTLDRWFEDMGVDVILSVFPKLAGQLYPRMSEKAEFKKVYAGYVSEELLEFNKNHNLEKKWDIGYRASKLPYWFGSLGQFKYRLGKEVAERLQRAGLSVNSSTDTADFLHGEAWYFFLSQSKAVLGSESGSSLIIRDSEAKQKTLQYLREHPVAGFDEVNAHVYSGGDGEVWLSSVSPRHFECASLKVCQVLVEGEYDGVMQADTHYIPIHKDFSNLEEVIDKLEDSEFCSVLVENCYRDVAMNPLYSYKAYSDQVINSIEELRSENAHQPDRWSSLIVHAVVYACSWANQFRGAKLKALAGSVLREYFPDLYLKLKPSQNNC